MNESLSNNLTYQLWRSGFSAMTFAVAEAAPKLMDAFKRACGLLGDNLEKPCEALVELHKVLRWAADYDGGDMGYLESDRLLDFDDPRGGLGRNQEY